MAKCKVTKKVSKAGKDLGTSNNSKVKSAAGKTLQEHKAKQH
jgi:hypothetical protein